MYRIMLVDDEKNILKALRRVPSITPCVYDGAEYQFKTATVTSHGEALHFAHLTAIDLAVSDSLMPGMGRSAILDESEE